MLRTRLAAALAVATTALAPNATAPAYAAQHVIVSAASIYAPAELTIAKGDTVTYANTDTAPHNVVSDALRNNAPLFRSATITFGQTADVVGVDKLDAGVYGYYCSIHPNMRGTIRVGTSAAPGYVAVPVAQAATPTSLTIFGDSLYVASYGTGVISRMQLLPGGALGAPAPYVSGFTNPLGIAFAPDGTLFVSDSHTSGTTTVGRVSAVPPGGAAAAVVLDGLPNGRHNTNGLAVHNGRLYVTNGNSTDDGRVGGPPEQALSGTLLSVPLSARNLKAIPDRNLVVEAKGMRNLYDVAFRPGTNQAWIPTNGPDALDPWGEDTLNVADVRGGTVDFGFPACVWKPGPDGRPQRGQNPGVPQKCNPKTKPPELLLGLHVSANGLAFGPAQHWNGDLVVALFGNNPGEQAAGHKVVRVPIVNGRARPPVDVLQAASPLDLTFGPAGLYVADFATGAINLVLPVG